MKVKAETGVKVPMAGAPRRYITDQKEVEVDDNDAYYLRRIAEGDLVNVTAVTEEGVGQTTQSAVLGNETIQQTEQPTAVSGEQT